MRLGIMQPYFFPYLGHFALIAHSDNWIVFDVTQYTPKTWMNRNRVLHPTQGWNYVTVPLSNGSISIRTCEAHLLDPAAALQTVLGKLSHYRRWAPYYEQVLALVRAAFADVSDLSLVRLNVRGLQAVCDYLGLPFRHRICSELALDLPAALGPGEWALEICARVGARTYLNPAGGRELFDRAVFAHRGLTLQFLEAVPLVYDTPGYNFEPQLSVLDVLMWNDPDQVRAALFEQARILD